VAVTDDDVVAVTDDDAAAAPVPAWRSLFASAGDEPRRRRVDDVGLLAVALVTGLVTALVAGGPSAGGADAVVALEDLLGWLDPLWSLAYALAGLLVVVLLVAAMAGRRRALGRDIVLAVGATLGGGALLAQWVDGRWPSWSTLTGIGSGTPTYPALMVAIVTAVALVSLPDLTRPVRRTILALVPLAAVATVVLGDALPAQVLGGVAVGAGVAAGVRLAFGSSAGFPQERRVLADLAALGVDASDVWRDDLQHGGVARYRAVDGAGTPYAVAVYGRDARDTQIVARVWRSLWYRDAGPEAALTRREQVEHEGLMLFAAARAGVRVPAMAVAGTVDDGDALLVTDEPDAPPLALADPATVGDDLLAQAWAAAAALRAARIGHGRLNTWSLVAGPDGLTVTRLAGARLHADDDVLDTDLAELLVSCALLVGEERALRVARDALGDDAVRGALPFVQRAALTPAVRDEVHDAGFDIAALRERVVDATGGGDMPSFAEVRRVSLRDVVLVALTATAAYLLISQLADVGISTIVDELQGAAWSWVLLALVIAQGTLFTDALATLAAVGRPLPLGPTTVLQSAVKFINLTVPSAAGKIALTMRFLERQGVPRPVALTQGSIDGLAGFAVQVLVLLIVVPISGVNFDLGNIDATGLVWATVAVAVGAVICAVLALALPKLRARVWPFIAAALGNAKGLATSPGRLVRLILANVASQLLYAISLGCSVKAFGSSASLADLLLVNTGTTLLAGMVPIPGGIGVAEAGLVTGLVAVGVPKPAAMAAALVHRLCTYYLPPVWGWFSLRWLGRHGFV
jgi:uncharacterized membrane protein YbhN (UPF0104 family)